MRRSSDGAGVQLARLRLIALVAPLGFIGVVFLARPLLARLLGSGTAHAVIGVAIIAGAVWFSFGLFHRIERLQAQLADSIAARERAEQRAALLRRQDEATAAERARLARELHDTLAQSLSVAHLRLRALGMDPAFSGEPAVRQQLDELADLCQSAQRETRDVIGALRDGTGDIPLTICLEREAGRFTRRTGLPVDLDLPADSPDVPPPVQLQLVRIAQEALMNTGKHADARRVLISLDVDATHMVMTVQDDGRGFDPRHTPGADRFGLQAMRERVAIIGGRLSLHSAPGSGTRVRVQVPTRELDGVPA